MTGLVYWPGSPAVSDLLKVVDLCLTSPKRELLVDGLVAAFVVTLPDSVGRIRL